MIGLLRDLQEAENEEESRSKSEAVGSVVKVEGEIPGMKSVHFTLWEIHGVKSERFTLCEIHGVKSVHFTFWEIPGMATIKVSLNIFQLLKVL